MCNIVEKRKKIEIMANGIVPKEYRRDNEKRYNIEHDKYLAIKNEIISCNDDERSNLEILFKCDYESYKRMSGLNSFAVFAITALNLLLTSGAMATSLLGDVSISKQAYSDFVIVMVGVVIILIFVVMLSQRYSGTKLTDTLYILEIFKTCNKSESQ